MSRRDSARVRYKQSQDPTCSLPGTVGGPGGYSRTFLQKFSPCLWRIPTGAPPSPCRAVYRLDPWFICRNQGPARVKKRTAPGPGPTGSRAGRPKNGQKREAPFVNCDQGTTGHHPPWFTNQIIYVI